MAHVTPTLRLQGVYEQTEPGRFMLRVKMTGGLLSAEQAEALADLARRRASGILHLTTRMSIELHGIPAEGLEAALQDLDAVGLTSRGACGGAVRGVAVSTPFSPGWEAAQDLAVRIQSHFTGNPEFEGLPKKFKIGADAGYQGARHLIQDVGLVLAGFAAGTPLWDVWLGGGLGRQPREAFLATRALPDSRVIPLVEAVARAYLARVPAGKRLKYWVTEAGPDAVREALAGVLEDASPPGEVTDIASVEGRAVAFASVFAGELPWEGLRFLASMARRYSDGVLVLTPNQNIALPLLEASGLEEACAALAAEGFGRGQEAGEAFRLCPGSHECKMGLAATRDIARAIVGTLGPAGRQLTWAVSGCPNSCAQPQLADVGILCTRLVKAGEKGRLPRFDVLRRDGGGFGHAVLQNASLDEVLTFAQGLG